MSADDILLGAKLPEATVRVCTRGDLVEAFRRLDEEIARAQAATDPRLAGSVDPAKRAELEDLREQVEAATVEFRLRSLGRRWRVLVDVHPPRNVNGKLHEDDDAGVNNETFFPALIKASTVEPQLRDETWKALLAPDSELLSEAQYRRLARACWNLNVREPDIPFSVAGLLMTETSGSGSDSPEPSA